MFLRHCARWIQQNVGLTILWATFIVSFVFVYNKAFHATQVDYIREAVLALMASSVTILITTLLLRQQTKSEELKETHSEIFRKKFEVYTKFVTTLIGSFEDEENRPDHVRRLEEDFYQLLLFIESQHTFDKVYAVILESLKDDSREKIGLVLHVLRKELGIHEEGQLLQHSDFWNEVGSKMNDFFETAEKYRKTTL